MSTETGNDEVSNAKSDAQDEAAPEIRVRQGVASEKKSFQAETKQLLNIVTHSIYTDKDVFLRELVSNAADALEKFRHLQTAGTTLLQDDKELAVRIEADEKNNTITISDNGIGMTHDEMIENLGTIARSGSRAFLEELRESNTAGDVHNNLIGMFGVGFYSAFMVADRVAVYSRSARDPDAPAYCWQSSGAGDYELVEAENVPRGTRIVMYLKDDAQNFAKRPTVEDIVMRYSNFVSFPILLNKAKVNTVRALWAEDQAQITDDEFTEFYRYVGGTFDNPMYRVHFSSDAPIHLRALFFVGENNPEKKNMGRMSSGISVYSRKVLIKSKAEEVLPPWLRFFRGVVDSEDLPLSISRENMQDSSLIRRLGNVLTRRLLKFLETNAKTEPERYNSEFWENFGAFIKEGVVSDNTQAVKPFLARLLRFRSSKQDDATWTSLDEYIARCPMEQKHIYYLVSPTRALAESSPYYETFRERGLEVLFCHDPVDEFTMQSLVSYEGRNVISAERSDVELPDIIGKSDEAKDEDAKKKKEAAAGVTPLSGRELTDFREWVGHMFKGEVLSVKSTTRLSSTPALITGHQVESMRRMMEMAGMGAQDMERFDLEINPEHPVIVRINSLREDNPEVASMVMEQVFDNAKCAAGILDDPRTMLPRINRILDSITKSVTPAVATPSDTASREVVEPEVVERKDE